MAPRLGRDRTRHRHRVLPGPDPRCRRDHPDLRRLRRREAPVEDTGGIRQRRHRGRGRARDGQQCLRQRRDDPVADARHPELADHRGADGRLHHQRPDARPVPLQGAPRPRLGGDRKLHDRQCHAADPEPAVRRPVGAAAAPAVSVRVRRACCSSACIGAYSLQQSVFDVWRHDRLRGDRLRLAEDRSSDRAIRARIDPRTVHREVAAHLARNVGRRFLDLLHAAFVPRPVARRRARPGRLAAAPDTARSACRSSPRTTTSGRRTNDDRLASLTAPSPALWRSPRRPATPARRSFPTARCSSWSRFLPAAEPTSARASSRRLPRSRSASRSSW